MSYTALYRKFRPVSFVDVKGQEHIVTTLKNQIKAGRIGHAYLFCGTRGTGKTTIAKLLAKVVNCENPVDGNPCNECRMCKGIASQTSMNVIEIDAASNNGVDNVREIVEEVRYSPTEGRYKVYIIDEVHMLSSGAFNALLKTIEEPPSYVIFILATTEVHKIPVTILSRCQRYDFKRITIDVIAERLTELMQAENVEAEEKALRYIARMADGSLRDALSLMDQCISFYLGKRLTYDNVLEVIWYLRNLLLLKTTEDISDIIIEISTENLALLQQEAATIDEQAIIRYIRIFSELSNQIRYAARKRVLIEIAIIKMCKPEMEQNLEAMIDRLKILEEKLEKGVIINSKESVSSIETMKEQPVKTPVILPEALPDDLKEAAKNWKNIITQVAKKAPALGAVLQSATPSVDGNQGLSIVVTDMIDKDLIDREAHMQIIIDTISQLIHKQVKVSSRYLDRNKERIEEVPDLSKLIKAPIQYE
ncbi:MAG: hypothetical protein K0R34_4428 [Herbinix sp.]|nr:hypothetical protein [Herbinix sp.]